MKQLVTKDYVINYLSTQPRVKQIQFVGRALVVVFNNQTESEKRVDTTKEDNGVGFTGADAYSGSLSAKSFLKNKTLADWQFDRWVKPNGKGVPRIAKYWKQLNDAAVSKSMSVGNVNPKPAQVKIPAVVMPQAEFLPENITQKEMDRIEAEMNRMDFEGELAAEQRAFEWKMARDEQLMNGAKYDPKTGRVYWPGEGYVTDARKGYVNPTAARRSIRARADQRSL